MENKRQRGRKLQEIRRLHFMNNPLCARCLANGRVAAAVELDHVVPLSKGGSDTDPGNKQGLCKSCHEEKTAEDMGWSVKQAIGEDGWPL